MFSNYKNSASSISLLILLVLGFAAVFAPHSTGESAQWPNIPHTEKPPAPRDAFGRLPLSFELNQGQTDSRVKFLARGHGYALFLTDNGAVFSFSETKTALHMRLLDAATSPQISGVDQLPGKVNYLFGNKPTEWRTGIPTYARVRYEQVYKGVDLIYYGNQRQLEYDFVVQPGANFKQIRLSFDGAGKPRLNRRGELIFNSGAHKLTLLRPKAYQEIENKRREVSVRYALKSRGEVAFQVGNYDKSQPLVIDPLLVYSTFLGGSGQDAANSIAVDSSGNAYIAGSTRSPNFPISSPMQATHGGGVIDAFVAKLNADGSALIYSTFLGGASTDNARSIAVDNAGNAYLTGDTSSTNFPVFNALHPTLTGLSDAFVAELNSAGSGLVYSTYLGGHSPDIGNSIAIDNSGNAYVTGTTSSTDFPTTNPVQANRSGHALFKTTNAAGNWAPSDSGLAASSVNDLVFQPGNSSTIYAATDAGLFKSTDTAANWSALPATLPFINGIAIDPVNPAIIYAATDGGVFKSTDGGNSFTLMNNGLSGFVRTIAINPVTPTTLYATISGSPYFKSVDGGASWTVNFIPQVFVVDSITIDPNTPATLYANTDNGIYKSTNSGSNWTLLNTGIPNFLSVNSITIDPIHNLIYAATTFSIMKSADGGATWTNIFGNLSFNIFSIVFDPTNTSVLYAETDFGIYKTIDGGSSWNESNTGYSKTRLSALVINPTQPSILIAGTTSTSDAFITKLSAGGAAQIYSTFLGGNLQEQGNGITLDAAGNAYITGFTGSTDFPTANALQPNKGDNLVGASDAFIAKLNASGSALVYSTFLGAESSDSGRAIAVDTNGNAYVCGSTGSLFFPTVNAFQPQNPNFFTHAFVTKVNAAGSALVYSTYLAGSSSEDCLAIAVDPAGSAYVTGNTNSPDFPTVAPVQAGITGFINDAFLTKLAPSGSSLVHSTYLGGAGNDVGRGIALDSSQNIYVAGSTSSTDFPTKNPLQPVLGGSTDVFVAKLRPAPDVRITLTDTPDPVDFGSNLNYVIDLKNIGELAATGVTVTDTLPAGSTFVSLSATAGISCSGTSAITCNVGTLNPGATGQISIQIKPPAVSPISNTANVTLNEADGFPANNTATTETTVRFTDISITKTVAQSLVAAGGRLTYSLRVKNNGPLSSNATVTDNLPAGTSLINCVTTTTAVCTQNGNTANVVFTQLAPGTSETVLVIAAMSPSAIEAVFTNTASVVSTIPDINAANDSASASVTVVANANPPKSNGLIAFFSERSITGGAQPTGIYTIKPDGTDEKVFPNTPSNALEPSWSPDGTRLAFQTFGSETNPFADSISIINADGTGLVKVATNASHSRMISWSPNGSQIAYVGFGGPDISTLRTVHIANADGSGSYRLPGSPSLLDAVDWSPDGAKFAYAKEGEIFVMNADATGQVKLTNIQQTPNGPTNDLDPRWSPDGTKIMVLRNTGSTSAVHVMNADGSNLRRLFDFNGPTAAWSPDGVSIVAQVGGEICTVHLDNTNFKCLTNDNFTDMQPNWQRLPNPNPTPTPTPQSTFSITGKVSNADGSPVLAQVKLTSSLNTFPFPSGDANGNFEFINLPAGEYTLTPIDIFHTFQPASRTVTITNANITGQDFVGTFAPATISGHIKDNNGNPLGGIQITIGPGGFQPISVVTDANGFYSATNLQRHVFYFITPDPLSPYEFVPANKVIPDLTTSEVVDFVGTLAQKNVIAGRVVEAISGQGIGGLRIDLAQDGGATVGAFTNTDSNGNFSFGNQKANHSYALSIIDTPQLVFSPKLTPGTQAAVILIPSLQTDLNVTFSAAKRNTVQFSAATSAVDEGGGFREIVVTRSGDLTSAANVNFATADTAGLAACSVANGKASERCDYGSTAGTLRFAAGEASKSFVVPIVNDVNVEGNETFTIALSGPVGAQLGSNASVTVTITDNDAAPVTQNPIDGIDPFVTQQYIDFLGRLPDSVGFANWVGTLNGCPNGGFGENDNPSCDRVHVSAGFFLSDEFRGRGYFAYRFYEVAFDRRPLYAEFVPDMAQVGGAQSPESEILSKAAYTDAFVQRGEFTSRYNGLTNAAYVNALEQNAEITLANKADLIAALDANQKSRAQVLREIVESKAVEDRFFIRAFVAMQYFGYLRRDPDTIGYNNWVTTLTNDPSNFRHMIFGFLFSTEYRGRFGP